MTKKTQTFKRRLAARRAIALLTGSHACLGLANRMVGPVEFRPEPPRFDVYEEATVIPAGLRGEGALTNPGQRPRK